MGTISDKLSNLIATMEERENLYIRRIEFVQLGDTGRVRLLDEDIFPLLTRKMEYMALEVTRAFRHRIGDENERQKTKTQNS